MDSASSMQDQFKHWVTDQMNTSIVPLSSHREFFRKRLNPRFDHIYSKGRPGPRPCDMNSRWRTFAFTTKDTIPGRVFTVSSLDSAGVGNGSNGSTGYILKVDGHIRTVVNDPVRISKNGQLVELDKDYPICEHKTRFYQEGFGELFRIKLDNGKCRSIEGGIPLVDISEIEALDTYNLHVLDLTTADLVGIDDSDHASFYWSSYEQGDEFILQSKFDSSSCESIPDIWTDATEYPLVPIFGKIYHPETGDVQYLLYDPRLSIFENTLENPASDGGGRVTIETNRRVSCANTHRNFINEEHCVLSYDETACPAASSATAYVNMTTGKNDHCQHNTESLSQTHQHFCHRYTNFLSLVRLLGHRIKAHWT